MKNTLSKKCNKCLEEKDLSEFGILSSSKDGHALSCKECRRIEACNYRKNNPEAVKRSKRKSYLNNRDANLTRAKEYRERNKDVISEKRKKYYKDNKDAFWSKYILNKYGITAEVYLSILQDQEFRCGICSTHVEDLPIRLSVDRCHSSSEVRGLLCKECITGLGNFKHNKDLLSYAISYLSESSK